jgi:hypothetical protein
MRGKTVWGRRGGQHRIDDLSWQQANERLVPQPIVNIEGIQAERTVLERRGIKSLV